MRFERLNELPQGGLIAMKCECYEEICFAVEQLPNSMNLAPTNTLSQWFFRLDLQPHLERR